MIFNPGLKAYLNKQVSVVTRKEFNQFIMFKFEQMKKNMIEEFMNHPVTQEIMDGPNASNISGTLGGKGNLFSFIGFEEGSNPIEPIKALLEGSTIVDIKGIPGGRQFQLNIPSAKDIFAVTPMPWATGRSWAKGIESGISGLGYYLLRKTQASRSGAAIQTSVNIRSSRFKNTPYISALINKYTKEINKIQ
jgi:hypothetical protein